ncbi:hypothetical protein D3C81_732130 [compost metagenome]
MVDLDVAEELVVLGFAGRDLCSTQGDVGRFGTKMEAMAIQVIAISGDEAQLDGLRIALNHAELEGFVHRQKVGTVVQRRGAQGGAGTVVEQAGADGGQGQKQENQAKQAAHGGLAVQKCLHDNGLLTGSVGWEGAGVGPCRSGFIRDGLQSSPIFLGRAAALRG